MAGLGLEKQRGWPRQLQHYLTPACMTILCRMQICANTLPFLALGNVGVKSANNSLKLCPEEFGHQSSPNPTKPRATTVGKKNQGLVVSVLPLLQSIVSTQMSIGRRRRKIRSLESTTCHMLHAEDAAKMHMLLPPRDDLRNSMSDSCSSLLRLLLRQPAGDTHL
jgi:hypothetical protein